MSRDLIIHLIPLKSIKYQRGVKEYRSKEENKSNQVFIWLLLFWFLDFVLVSFFFNIALTKCDQIFYVFLPSVSLCLVRAPTWPHDIVMSFLGSQNTHNTMYKSIYEYFI